jgi:hypothetical protein
MCFAVDNTNDICGIDTLNSARCAALSIFSAMLWMTYVATCENVFCYAFRYDHAQRYRFTSPPRSTTLSSA